MDSIINKYIIINFAIYKIVISNLGEKCLFSFYNMSNKKYIRHYNSLLREDRDDGTQVFKTDSSFKPFFDGNFITFSPVNQGLEDYWISSYNGYCISNTYPVCFFKIYESVESAKKNIILSEIGRI